MPWTVDDSMQRNRFNAGKHVPVPPAAMKKYFDWKSFITGQQMAPKTAADRVGDTHYEQLGGRFKGLFTIRLSQEHRVVFEIDQARQLVTVRQIGGHFP